MTKLAKRTKLISPSATLDITAKAKKMKREGADVVNLGAGEPDFDTPQNIKSAAIAAIKEGFTKYTPSSGILELREAAAAKFKKDNNLTYPPSAISISCGAKHSLYNIFQAVAQEGDEVIIPSPYWLSYPEMVKLAGAKPVFLEAGEKNMFKVRPADLKRGLSKKTKAVIINSPSNPTGAVYNRRELEEIADIAVSKNVLVVSDEIYSHIIFGGIKHVSIASLGDDIKKLALVVNGVSKSYSMTGWRIGYVAGDEEIIAAINNIQSHSTSNPASISQRAALEALTGDQTSVSRMRDEFESRRDYITERANNMKKISAVKPEGAFYIFCNIEKTGYKPADLANRLLDEAKVAVIPGEPFGSQRHIRLSFAANIQEIAKGMDRIERWLKEGV